MKRTETRKRDIQRDRDYMEAESKMDEKAYRMQVLKLMGALQEAGCYNNLLKDINELIQSGTSFSYDDIFELCNICQYALAAHQRSLQRLYQQKRLCVCDKPHEYALVHQYEQIIRMEAGTVAASIRSAFVKFQGLPTESTVLCLIMQGDCYFAEADCSMGEDKEGYIAAAEKVYSAAISLANEKLHILAPPRLRALWHNAVLLYKCRGARAQGFAMLKSAFDEGIMRLDCVDEDYYKVICFELQGMRDRLTTWLDEENPNLSHPQPEPELEPKHRIHPHPHPHPDRHSYYPNA